MTEKFINKSQLREIASINKPKPEDIIDDDFKQTIIAKWMAKQPKERDFIDIYGSELVQKAKQAIIDVKKKFGKTGREIGALGENICLQGFYDEEWLPAVADVIKTSEYDDFFRNTDAVLRFNSEAKEPLYLGLDIKTIRDSAWATTQIEKLKESIRNGQLTNLRYFYDEDRQRKGGQTVPSLIIVVDPRYALALQKVMLVSPIKRNKIEKNKVEFFKNVMNAEIIAQLMEIDLFFDLEGLVSPAHKKIQGKYRDIIKSIMANVDFDEIINYIEKLASMTEEMIKEYPELHAQYLKYLITFEDYQARRK